MGGETRNISFLSHFSFGKLSIGENLVMTSPYVRPYVRKDSPGRGK